MYGGDMYRASPSSHVLKAFRLSGDPARTHTRDAWRVGSAALKRVEHPDAVEWISNLLATRSSGDGFRVPCPIANQDGGWVVDGWSASEWLPGKEDGSRWRDILEAGAAFHDWLAPVERPPWIDDIDDPWRRSDRAAWGEQSVDTRSDFAPSIDELESMRQPVLAQDQLIHGDLTGNVLFSAGQPPSIIDLTLYWRPPGYAAAIVAVDCYGWEDVGSEVLDEIDGLSDGAQLLIRAALFRIIRQAMDDWVEPESRLKIHRRIVIAIRARTTRDS